MPSAKKQSKIDALTERFDQLIKVLGVAVPSDRLPGEPIRQPPLQGHPFTEEARESAIEMLGAEQEIPNLKEEEDSAPLLSLTGALTKGQITASQFALMHLALVNPTMAQMVLENLHKVFPL